MSHSIFFLLAALIASVQCGCATIIRGEHQRVDIQSDPPGARVVILPSGEEVETPARIKLRRDTSLTLFVQKAGYRATRVYVDREHDAWASLPFVGNLAHGGFLGMSIDYDSGALLHLVPNPVEIVLEPGSATTLPNGHALDIPSSGGGDHESSLEAGRP